MNVAALSLNGNPKASQVLSFLSFIAGAVLICTVGLYAVPLDPTQPITRYGRDVWQEEEGLPQSSVGAIVQTPDGYLWMGTQEGLVRFDGVKFDVFDRTNTDAIVSNFISAILVASDSSLWVGTRGGGLVRMKDRAFRRFSVDDGLSGEIILSLSETPDGSIWIGTRGGGLNRYKDGEFTSFGDKEGCPYFAIAALFTDRSGTLWIGAPKGLTSYRHGAFKTYTAEDGFTFTDVYTIHEGKQGELWIGLMGGGLVRYANRKFTAYTTKDGLSSNSISALWYDNQGVLWVGTMGGGLNRLIGSQFSSYTTKHGLSADFVASLLVDGEGNLWIGTDGGGVNRLKENKFHSLSKDDGLSGDFVYALLEDHRGDMWFGTAGAGLNRYQDGRLTVYTTKDGLPSNSVRALCEEPPGVLWIGTTGGGLAKMVNGRISVYDTSHGLKGTAIQAICKDGEGGIWVGTPSGLNHFKNGRFTTISQYDGLPSNYIMSLHPSSGGGLWIGTAGGGLSFYKNGSFTHYTKEKTIPPEVIWAIFEDSDGAVWTGTNGGLGLLRHGNSFTFTTRHGLGDDIVFSVMEDGSGHLWMSSNRGIFRVSKQQLDEVARGEREKVDCYTFGRADGMKSRECNGGTQPAAWRARDGRMWFPTIKGVVFVDPDNLRINPHPPRVAIESIMINDEQVDCIGPLMLTPGRGNCEFGYTGLSFSAPGLVRFKYRLEGFDNDWVDAGFRRTAYYTNLPPGKYTFRVIASNSDGVWNEEGESYTFTLPPFFHQTPLFYSLCLVMVGLIALGGHKFRLRQVRTKELVSLVDERTRDLVEEKEKTERALIEVRAAQETIREQARLLDKAQEAIFVRDLSDTIQFWNKGAERLYGWTGNEAIGRSATELLHAGSPRVLTDANTVVRSTGEWSGEIEQVTRGGQTITVQSHWTLIRDDDGAPKSILVINLDVTEKKKIETQFLRAQRMQSLGTLAGGIAHDLNNVLSPILLSLELLRMKVNDESGQRAIQTMETSAQRGAGIIKQVLAFSRGMEGDRSAVQMKYIVSELEKIAKDTFPRSIRVTTNVEKTLWTVLGDPTQLYQVLMNLCVNARDAMPEGGELSVVVQNRTLDEHYARTHQDAHAGNYVVLTVSDTGTGIPRETLDKIFEPFFTTKELGKGTGLGLSTALGIVKSHGGLINVYSEVGEGTKFDVYLPANGASNEPLPKTHGRTPFPRGNGELVLVVDDEVSIRDVNKSMLETYGYRVISAGDGAEAVELMREHTGKVKVVITDMMMPVMDGTATIKSLREIDPSLKFVAVSGLMGDQKVSEISQLGKIMFLQKPFTTDRLLHTLHDVLGKN